MPRSFQAGSEVKDRIGAREGARKRCGCFPRPSALRMRGRSTAPCGGHCRRSGHRSEAREMEDHLGAIVAWCHRSVENSAPLDFDWRRRRLRVLGRKGQLAAPDGPDLRRAPAASRCAPPTSGAALLLRRSPRSGRADRSQVPFSSGPNRPLGLWPEAILKSLHLSEARVPRPGVGRGRQLASSLDFGHYLQPSEPIQMGAL